MAKRMPKEAEVVDKELVAFVDVVRPAGPIDQKTGKAIMEIAKGFLDSLTRRYQEAEAKVDVWALDPTLNRLIGKNGVVVIASQEDADEAGRLCNEIAATGKEIEESWEKETGFFHRFHKALTERRGKCQRILDGHIGKLKGGVRFWLLAEADRKRKAEAAANERINQQFQSAGIKEPPPPVSFEKPAVAGMSGRASWGYNVPDKLALIKAVARGKAPIEALEIAESWVKKDVNLNHARAIENPETHKKYLYDGTVEIFEDLNMARREKGARLGMVREDG